MISGNLRTETQDESVWLVVFYRLKHKMKVYDSGYYAAETQDETVWLMVLHRQKHNMKLYD